MLARQVSKQMELRQMNDLLRQANQEAEHHRDSLKQMIQLIAHDLRSPLGGLVSLIDLLSDDFRSMDAPEIETFLEKTKTSGHQVFTLLDNLLEWSSSEAALLKYKPEPVFFYKLIEEVMDAVTPLAKA